MIPSTEEVYNKFGIRINPYKPRYRWSFIEGRWWCIRMHLERLKVEDGKIIERVYTFGQAYPL